MLLFLARAAYRSMTEMAHVLKENYSITYLNLRNNACGTHLKGSLGNQLAGFGEFFKWMVVAAMLEIGHGMKNMLAYFLVVRTRPF